MKKFYYLVFFAFIGIAFSSCSLIGQSETEFYLSDLQGLWLEDNTQHYVRFTTEQTDEDGYLYGREWDEAEDVFETDLLKYGNGWFKYLFETTDKKLTEIHLMDNGGADIPKIYVVTALSDGVLKYYEKDQPSIKYSFSKIVETKE